jgi:S1-C subfamily serine protease
MKYLNYAKVGFFLGLIILCVGCCSKKTAPEGLFSHEINKKPSVFLVGKTVELIVSSLDGSSEESIEPELKLYSASSGTGVSVFSNQYYSDILTAGHVCATEAMPALFGQQYVVSFALLDFKGNNYSADLIAFDLDSDLCLLRIYRSTHPISVSNKTLKNGDEVFYSGYPLGIYNAYTLHHFAGYFSGSDPYGFHMYSLPAAPGSSGSPVYDMTGELVGIISAIPQEFSHLSIGPGAERIKAFLFLTRDCAKHCVTQ